MDDPTRIDMTADPHTRLLSGVTMLGGHQFSVPYVTEIAVNLWQGGCADGLVLPDSFRHLVSLYQSEHYTVKHGLQSALAVAMLDRPGEDLERIPVIAAWVNACRKTGPVLVHCQAGLNRSSLVVAAALMLEGATAESAIALIRHKRSPACLCNPAFEDWLLSFHAEPRLKLADYRRVYLPSGRRAHLSPPFSARSGLCAIAPEWPADWLGTGSQDEYDRAAALPLCRRCQSVFGASLAEAA